MSFVVHSEDSTRQLIYIHIPKCAGQAVGKWLGSRYQKKIITNGRTMTNNYHSTIEDARASVNDFENSYTMAVIRNPWKRAFSWYTYRKPIIVQQIADLSALGRGQENMSNDLEGLKQEYRWMCEGFPHWLDRYIEQPWDNTWFSLSMPMVTWLGQHKFDLIVDCEHNVVKQFVEKFKDDFKKSRGGALPKINVSNGDNTKYVRHYNQQARDLVAKYHSEDIERFGYTFD